MTHIITAAVDGPKAGMRQYLAKLASYAPGTKQRDILSEYLALGNEKAIFEAYCANFTEQITAEQAKQQGNQDEDALLASLLGTESADTDEDEDEDGVGVVVEQQGGRESVIEKVTRAARGRRNRTSTNGVPQVGDTFIYHGANGDSTHTVIGEGTTKKHKKPGLTCRNVNGKDRVWNLKTLAIYAEQGKITVA